MKQIVTPEWAEAFAAHASPDLGALCFFMLGTGARIGQALGVQWRHIDLGQCEARIPMSLKNHEEHVAICRSRLSWLWRTSRATGNPTIRS